MIVDLVLGIVLGASGGFMIGALYVLGKLDPQNVEPSQPWPYQPRRAKKRRMRDA